MRNLLAVAAIAVVSGNAFCGPFGLLNRRVVSNNTTTATPQYSAPVVFNSSAQGVANHMARILRIGHFGGNPGYEGVGCGSTPYQAEMNCCFRQRMQPREVGLAQGSNGMWYACCRY